MLLGPSPGVAAQRIVATVIAAPAELLEDPDQRQLLASRLGCIAFQQFVEFSRPSSQLRSRLDRPLVLERRLSRPQYPPNRIPGHPEVPRDLLDRLAFDEVLPPNPCNRLHDQHSLTTRFESKREACNGYTSGGQFWTPIPRLRGSILHAE